MPARDPSVVVLGLDVGTTATKVTAFTLDGRAVAGAERPTTLAVDPSGRAEQDPAELRRAVISALAEVVGVVGVVDRGGTAIAPSDASRRTGRSGGPPSVRLEIAGVAVSTAMHGLCAVGGDDRPLTPILTWADTRATRQADRLRAEDPELHDRTGTPVHPMSPLAKLVWFREEDPETFAAARRWVGVKELVLHALTGAWALDESVASGTGLWASATRDWDPAALAHAGIDADRLTKPVPTTTVLSGLSADAARATALPRRTPIVIGAGDGPSANVGVGAGAPAGDATGTSSSCGSGAGARADDAGEMRGVAACSIGTSGALRLTVDRPAVDADRALFSYVLDERRWVTGGAINNGGSVLRWAGEALAPDLGPHAEESLLALAADAPAGCDGLVMLPSLLSERAPAWTGDARGAYLGLTAAHGRAHLVRAAVEGVGFQLALVLRSLRAAGHRIDEVRATGGFARSGFWRQLLTDQLGTPVGFPDSPQGSGRGAALLGAGALGLIDDDGVDVAPAETLEPDPEAAGRYAELLPVFGELQAAVAPGLAALRRAQHPD